MAQVSPEYPQGLNACERFRTRQDKWNTSAEPEVYPPPKGGQQLQDQNQAPRSNAKVRCRPGARRFDASECLRDATAPAVESRAGDGSRGYLWRNRRCSLYQGESNDGPCVA
jgi:hypothetical protein